MSLAYLPNELLAMICDYSDKHALKALRLTNRRISIQATTELAKRFKGHLAVLMTTQSLESLIALCEHPVFGPAVSKIHVTFSRVHQERVAYLEAKRNWLIKTRTIDEYSRVHHKLRCCKRRAKNEAELQKSGKAVELLTRAFSALQPYRTFVELMICSDHIRFYDKTTLLGCDCHVEENTIIESCPGSTIQLCLEAIRRSQMDFYSFHWYIDKKSITSAEMSFNLKTFSAEDMRVFRTLNMFAYSAQGCVPDSASLSISSILLNATALDVLTLSHNNHLQVRDSKPFETPSKKFEMGDYTLWALRSDRLFNVNLTCMAFSKQCLLDFLNHHKDTIMWLTLRNCTLRNGSWREVISYVKDNLSLMKRLKLKCLFDAGPRTPRGSYLSHGPAVLGMGSTRIEGKEEVQEVLEAIIERPLEDPTAPEDETDDESLRSSDLAEDD
ncbi:hypothetical protein KCU65_g7732, partial [Aureobasidium melanogenum]